jgi:PKD repeat protein
MPELSLRERLVVLSSIALSILASACAGDAPPTAPTALATHGQPATITLSATPGVGANGGRATIVARVQDAYAATLPDVLVTFATDAGTLSDAAASTNAQGIATSVLVADPGLVKVTATVGSMTPSETSVVVQPHVDPAPLAPVPPPPPPPPPPPAVPDLPFTIDFGVTPAPAGSATIFGLQSTAVVTAASWSFGDGATGTGATTTHVYAAANTYAMSVTATDARGRTASKSGNVTIPAPSYTVSVTASANPATGANTTLTATVVSHGALAVTTWAWDCTDDGTVDASTANTATCVYATAGTFTARVTVTGGTVTATATTSVTVTAAVPLVAVHCSQPTPAAFTENCNVTATLNGTPVLSSAITSVNWDFGDGQTATTTTNVAPAHIYSGSGGFIVTASNVVVTGTTATGRGTTNVAVQ